MKTYYVIDYRNGNRRIDEKDVIRREEKEFILTECYTPQELNEIKAELETAEKFDEWIEHKVDENLAQYIVGIVKAEHEPTLDDLVYDKESKTYELRPNFDFLKTFDEKKVFTDTAWVAENDPEVYAALHDMMLEFVKDESNQTFEDDLEAFEAGEWCVEYCFTENDGNLTVRIYAGETWQAVADQPPWLEDTVTVEEFKENYPYKKYTKKLED